jgi:uncharacterized membrane protein
LAVLLMFQTHAYDAFVEAGSRATVAYRVTRALGAVPAPAFLFLAGLGLALAEAGAARRGAAPVITRRGLAVRGLGVMGTGYAVSLAYALIDRSFAPQTLLRADILHAIGASIALTAALFVGRGAGASRPTAPCPGAQEGAPGSGAGEAAPTDATGRAAAAPWRLPALVAALAVAGPVALGDPAPRAALHPALAAPLALLVDVPGYTRFPLFPLVAFTIAGLVAGRRLVARPLGARGAAGLLCVGVAAAAVAEVATHAAVDALGRGPLTRAHPAVALNVVDGLARAAALLGAGLLLAPAPLRAVGFLLRLGRGSLLAYAAHIPLCYGALARPLARRFDMVEATGLVLVVALVTYAVVRVRDALRPRLWASRQTRPGAD